MIAALAMELETRKHELEGKQVETIYFGGGTPSLLKAGHITGLMDVVNRCFSVKPDAEVTLEANPEDVQIDTTAVWLKSGINRVSLGVQSFYDEDLLWMNRAHTAAQSKEAIANLQNAGFRQVSIDLIYGLPGMDLGRWQAQVQAVLEMGVNHLSAYHLTIEKKTALHHQVNKGIIKMPEDEAPIKEVEYLESVLDGAGWQRYEISNFCKGEAYAEHNTNYWRGKEYLGIGPSAHSFNGLVRRWNIANNSLYINGIRDGFPKFEEEVLSKRDRLNELLMLGLRTKWGVRKEMISQLRSHHLDVHIDTLNAFRTNNWLEETEEVIRLTRLGKLYADHIASELFWTD